MCADGFLQLSIQAVKTEMEDKPTEVTHSSTSGYTAARCVSDAWQLSQTQKTSDRTDVIQQRK